MKSFTKYTTAFFIILLLTGFTACGGGGSSNNDPAATSNLLTKITPLVEASIPKYTSTSTPAKSGILKSWSGKFALSLGEDSDIIRYFGDDCNSVFSNAEGYDTYIDKLNKYVNPDYTSKDSGVIVSAKSSITIACISATPITGDFHEVDFGDTYYEEFITQSKTIIAKNLHIVFENKGTSERAFIYYETANKYTVGTTLPSGVSVTAGTIFPSEIVLFVVYKENNTFTFDQYRVTEYNSYTKQSDKIWLHIDKLADGTFITKETEKNNSGYKHKAIATGNINSNFLIRHAASGADECFRIRSSDMGQLYPTGDNGLITDWTETVPGGAFPSSVQDSNFNDPDALDAKITGKSSIYW